MAAGGFSFGAKPATTTAGVGGFSFGTPSTTSTPSLGSTPATQTAGFNLTTQATTSAPTLGLSFGAAKSTAATTATGGFGFGTPSTATTTAASGFTLGATPSTKPLGLLGAAPATTTTAGGFGFAKPLSLGAPAGFGLASTSTTSSTAASGFGSTLGSTLGSLPATSTSIFGQTTTKPATTGLGGVDPKTTKTATSTAADGTKTSDSKTVKEAMVQNEILVDIENFKKYVKQEKSETEHIKRMSSTPMVKVQEDIISLRQLLSVVSNGLQRNSSAVLKLKNEMTQELKNAEMAMRTKEIPPGLQYENTAPTEYFQRLVEDFESQMLNYRQQIEMLESHLSSAHQPSRLTAAELTELLRKLHEAFIAMAAKLHQVHEHVKTQKEHYLNYRKVFLGDNKDIFERQKKAPVRTTPVAPVDQYGPNPFPGINNAAAVAMASAMTRSQQPQTQLGAGPPVTGFGLGQQSTASGLGFGSSTTQTSGFKGFGGGGGGGGLFGSTSTQPQSLFGLSSSATTGLAAPQPNLSSATEQPFQLNKPPLGTKRGKR